MHRLPLTGADTKKFPRDETYVILTMPMPAHFPRAIRCRAVEPDVG